MSPIINRFLLTLTSIVAFSSLNLFAASNELSRVIQSFSNRVDKEDGLSYTTSIELGRDEIREIGLYYSSKSPTDVDKARTLIVKVTDSFLEDVNSNAYLKGDLATYPLTPQQLDITIFFRGRNGEYAKNPNIAQVSMHKGVITFYKYTQSSFQIVHQENLIRTSKIAKG